MSIALVILAAGKGTRMSSDLPKVLHPIANTPMLVHAMQAGSALSPARTVVVAGHGFDAVRTAANDFDEDVIVVEQKEQNGTAHAVDVCREALKGFDGDVIVLFGDTPFVTAETLTKMVAAKAENAVVVLGFETAEPGKYGRLIMSGNQLDRIVEFADASDEERTVTFCNSGVMLAHRDTLFSLIEEITPQNSQGEYYLTDVVELARQRGLGVTAVACDEGETLGINSRLHLAEAEAVFQTNARKDLMELGVTLQQPETVMLSFDTVIGRDTIVEPNVYFGPGVTVESGTRIRAFSHLEGCHVSRGSLVGPYARLRPGAELSENVHVGNFVEIKNAEVGEGTKVNHLSYIGDATLGAGTNIGAGTITCNYDGVMKHHTTVGDNAFIGSNTMLVAPVTIGNEAMTGSGSVITKDVPEAALAIARAEQQTKPGVARKLFDILKKKKQKRALESK